MPDKIVNHFVLADGSVARYDYDDLIGAPNVKESVDLSNQYIAGGYIPLNKSVGTTIDITAITSSTNYYYIVVPCKAGDTFTITGYAGTTPRLWAFTDAEYKLLSVAQAELTVSDLQLVADSDGYFISDVYYHNAYALTHTYVADIVGKIDGLNESVNKLSTGAIETVKIIDRYYNSTNGTLHFASGFTCTNMLRVSPNDVLKVTTSAGDSVGIAGYDESKNYISNILETGSNAIYTVPRGVLTTEIVIPEDVFYITVSNISPNDTDISIVSNDPKAKGNNTLPDMLVAPRTTLRFDLYIKSDGGSDYLRHSFVKQYYSDTLTYGESQTKTVVGADVWYSDTIYHENEQVMAGNFNFIHKISNMEGHNGYVGAGHGCTVMDWCIFKADGVEFDTSITTKIVECTTFDFVIKAKNYLIDKPNSPSESHAVPTLDENGNPVVTSVNMINAHMKVGNHIEYRNRLIFKMDGIQFSECHGSMCEGYFTAFDNLIVSNNEESWNYIDSSNDYAREKKNGTEWDVFTAGSKKALSVIMFGDTYRVENKLLQLDGIRNKITNTRTALYRDNGARMKVYLMPVVCTISAQNIADGATVETFNSGDIIDVVSSRKITF